MRILARSGCAHLGESCPQVCAFVPLLRVEAPRALTYNLTTLWALATFPSMRGPLGSAGAPRLAAHALRRSLALATERVCPGRRAPDAEASPVALRPWWLRAAQWAAAVIWLLAYDDANCERALRAAGPLLVRGEGKGGG